MSATIVRSERPILLVGAGDVEPDDLGLADRYGATVVAADGGLRHLSARGLTPAAVIGDMDSISEADLAGVPPERLHRIEEQDTTDFDKCLRSVSAPIILATGFTGPRIDHALSVFNSLVRHVALRVIVLGAEDIVFHAPGRIAMDLPAGRRISLFPMAELTGRSDGLRWPLDGLTFAPDGRVGTSNEVIGPVRLDFDRPGMLVVTPRAGLASVMTALGG